MSKLFHNIVYRNGEAKHTSFTHRIVVLACHVAVLEGLSYYNILSNLWLYHFLYYAQLKMIRIHVLPFLQFIHNDCVFTTTIVSLNIPGGVLFTDFVKQLKKDRCFHELN